MKGSHHEDTETRRKPFGLFTWFSVCLWVSVVNGFHPEADC